MVAWDRVTDADVLRAIQEYDRLGRMRSSLGTVSALPRLMTWYGTSAVIRRKLSWVQPMNSPRASALPPAISRAERPAFAVLGKLGFSVQHQGRPAS